MKGSPASCPGPLALRRHPILDDDIRLALRLFVCDRCSRLGDLLARPHFDPCFWVSENGTERNPHARSGPAQAEEPSRQTPLPPSPVIIVTCVERRDDFASRPGVTGGEGPRSWHYRPRVWVCHLYTRSVRSPDSAVQPKVAGERLEADSRLLLVRVREMCLRFENGAERKSEQNGRGESVEYSAIR